jgi:hypothetical protein
MQAALSSDGAYYPFIREYLVVIASQMLRAYLWALNTVLVDIFFPLALRSSENIIP